jgi:hypothetical protein
MQCNIPFQLKKVRKYETVADERKPISFENIDMAPDTAFGGLASGIPTGKFVERADIVKGGCPSSLLHFPSNSPHSLKAIATAHRSSNSTRTRRKWRIFHARESSCDSSSSHTGKMCLEEGFAPLFTTFCRFCPSSY